ncbi:MAG: SpoIIE family protein phosphatase [Pirellulaceae bacterium]|nr:SpoIIE family protein phosphatase [Pirellulaceae bacterium]
MTLPIESRYCHSLPGLNRLLAVTRILAEDLDTGQALAHIVAEAKIALHCDRAIVYQFDHKREQLVATAGLDRDFAVDLDQGIVGCAAREGKLINMAHPRSDPRFRDAHDRLLDYHTQTVLAVPLIAARDERLLGVLELLNNVGGPFDSDDEALAVAFSHHAAAALDRGRLLAEIEMRRELEASLSVAREVQRRFMPSKMPPIPGYEVATWWYPNEAVGGDYCDVIALPGGEVALCVADVSGHGLGPSLLMASVRAALRTLLRSERSPSVLLEQLALALADDFEHGSFITMVLAMLAPERHEVTFANAGHGPAIHFQAAGEQCVDLEATGVPLGVVVPMQYPLGPLLALAEGDLLVLTTDGIVESFDQQGSQFGVERLQGLIRQLARAPLDDLVRAIGREVELHYVGDSPPDDLTILALRRTARS